MLKPEVIEHLSHNRDFAAFVAELYAIREQRIAELRECPTEKLQHLSGCITELDDILTMVRHESLIAQWAKVLS